MLVALYGMSGIGRPLKLAGTHADRYRFPAEAPDTMPPMICDDGIGIGPRPHKPELAALLLPTAQIPTKTAALTTTILFMRFILLRWL